MMKVHDRMLRLFLIRHGETADNLQMRYLGVRDEALTENGKEQASRVAEALSRVPVKMVISSHLRRARDTAAKIQHACGIELRLDERLAEGSFGNWEGLTRAEVLELGSRDAKLLAQWESEPSCAPPEGESMESIQRRIVALAEELLNDFPNSSLALVSHVGPIKALLCSVLGIPLQASRRLFLDPGSISVVEWGAHPVLRLFNSHAHLGWTAARWMK
jgi:ribonuclease H / adenosylcobalamin/alpha-ribazole phosphatase